jgi:hypothetical protein
MAVYVSHRCDLVFKVVKELRCTALRNVGVNNVPERFSGVAMRIIIVSMLPVTMRVPMPSSTRNEA